MNFIKAFAAVSAAAMLLALTGCDKNDSTSNNVTFYDSQNQYQYTPPTNNDKPQIGNEIKDEAGSTVSISKTDIALKSAEIFDTVGPDSYYSEKTDYIACRFDIKNNSDKTLSVSSLRDFLYSSSGEITELPLSSYILIEKNKVEDYTSIETEIPAGETLSAHVLLEIPSGWDSFKLYYTPYLDNTNNDCASFEITKDMLS